jgi:hypothetical protein
LKRNRDTSPQVLQFLQSRLVYVRRSLRLVDSATGTPLTSFKNAVPWLREHCPVPCEDYEGAVGEFIDAGYHHSVDDFRFFPGGPRLFTENDSDYINTWGGWNTEPGDIGPFLKLTERTFASAPKDAEWLLDLIAWHVQNPTAHIPFAGAIIGERLPADLWVSAIYEAFAPWSVRFGVVHLRSTNKAWMRNAVIGVMNGTGNGLEDRISGQVMCQIILSPDARVINDAEKQRSFSRNETSHMLVLCTLPNGRDKLLRNSDLFFTLPARPVDSQTVEAFHEWLQSGKARHLAHYLLHRDVSKFKPPAVAPMTQAARVAYREGLKPFVRLAHDMRESKENYIAHWISDALTWASDTILPTSSATKATKDYAQSIIRTFPEVTVRPWYTADEITLMFPDLFMQYPEIKRWNGVSPNLVSNELRAGGLPMLSPESGETGFIHNGRLANYFVVHNQDEWVEPLSQGRFETLMKTWPTYRVYVEQQSAKK